MTTCFYPSTNKKKFSKAFSNGNTIITTSNTLNNLLKCSKEIKIEIITAENGHSEIFISCGKIPLRFY